MSQYHLVVLVHGLWGNPSHMAYLAEQIELHAKPLNQEKLVVYSTLSHSGYLTYDGIGVNGKRVADELQAQKRHLESDGKVTKVSMIGYSMGGLIARYAIGVLKHVGFFEHTKPLYFVTFCTPHVGAINPGNLFSSRVFNMVAPYILSETGLQMFLRDLSPVGSRHLPLLEWMADPHSKFYKALEMFQHRVVYSNIINDKRTSWYTTAISEFDPFNSMINESLSAYDLHYISGYEPTVIDFTKPVSFMPISRPQKQGFDPQKVVFRIFVWLRLLCRFILFTPIYSIYLLCNYVWQRIRVSRRLKNFALESSGALEELYFQGEKHQFAYEHDLDKSYESDLEYNDSDLEYNSSQYEGYMNLLEETVRDETDLFVESIYQAMNSADFYDYNSSVLRKRDKFSKVGKNDNIVDLRGKTISKFKLNLTEAQSNIVGHLNGLKWQKYPVIIRKTKATHAAVINRYPDPSFVEGRVVVRHFVTEVFKV